PLSQQRQNRRAHITTAGLVTAGRSGRSGRINPPRTPRAATAPWLWILAAVVHLVSRIGVTTPCGMSEHIVFGRTEQTLSDGEEFLERGAEVVKAGEIAKVFWSASRCHHLLLACLSRYDHDISTD